MAVEIRFKGIAPTKNSKIEVLYSFPEDIFINITDFNSKNLSIFLDKETAIKLSKELRKQIALIGSEEGGYNG